MDGLSELGAMVRRLSTEAGLSGAELARRAGVPRSSVSRLEAGRRLADGTVSDRLVSALSLDAATAGQVRALARDAYAVPHGRRVSAGALYTTPTRRSSGTHDNSEWALRDTATGTLHRSGSDGDPASPHDVASLGRLPRPDGNGTILAIAGIHPQGSLGVARLLATDISVLWGQAADGRFSAIVGTDYDPATHEPVQTELLSPLYRHHQD